MSNKEYWCRDTVSVALVKEVLTPLMDIVMKYKESEGYKYVPGTFADTEAGRVYFDQAFQKIYKHLDANLFINQELYFKAKRIIQEMQSFTKSFSSADGLPKRYFEINPKLRYFTVAFELRDISEEAYLTAKKNKQLDYIPTELEFHERRMYLMAKEKESEDCGLNHDEDDFFMEELAFALRKIFLCDFEKFSVDM